MQESKLPVRQAQGPEFIEGQFKIKNSKILSCPRYAVGFGEASHFTL